MLKQSKSTVSSVAAVLLLGMSNATIAQTPPTTCPRGAVVIHVNGINTSARGAIGNLARLRTAMNRPALNDGEPITYNNIHNPNDGLANDLREVNLQLLNQYFPAGNSGLTEASLTAAARDGSLRQLLDQTSLTVAQRDRWEERINDAMAAYAQAAGRSEAISRQVADLITAEIQRGNKVVLVPHSQGNLVVNSAYNNLDNTDKAYVDIFAVATPANNVATGSNTYATLVNDTVISNTPLPALPGNVNNGDNVCDGLDVIRHSFVDCYLGVDKVSRNTIVTGVNSALDTLEFPTQEFSSGLITATLRWGAEPDVDLHAFEPGGSHVYYSNRVGTSGRLDLDDTTSFGPENYFVCTADFVQTGTYRIGVNYYRGSSPETAQVKIKAGSLTPPTISKSLPSSKGSAGNSSPVPVATISVTDPEGNGVYRFSIR